MEKKLTTNEKWLIGKEIERIQTELNKETSNLKEIMDRLDNAVNMVRDLAVYNKIRDDKIK